MHEMFIGLEIWNFCSVCVIVYKRGKTNGHFRTIQKHSLIVKEEMSIKFCVFYASLIVKSWKINLSYSDIIFILWVQRIGPFFFNK